MKALHSIWSEPHFSGAPYVMEDFELLTMILSALLWRKCNGEIKIVADRKVLDYFDKEDLLSIWNGGYELLLIDDTFSPSTFWAAGKIYALKQQTEPTAVIDADFIAWHNIEKLMTKDIVAAHKEMFNAVYPTEKYFKMDEKYSFKQFSWEAYPYNTAFLYIYDMIFKDYYTAQAINFMRHCKETKNDVCSMVFAEQRLLSMCAEQWGIEIGVLMDYMKLDQQKSFTHIWGYKQTLHNDIIKRKKFCFRCAERIKTDYPELTHQISKISQLAEYFDE